MVQCISCGCRDPGAAAQRMKDGHATPEWVLRSNLGLLCGNLLKTSD